MTKVCKLSKVNLKLISTAFSKWLSKLLLLKVQNFKTQLKRGCFFINFQKRFISERLPLIYHTIFIVSEAAATTEGVLWKMMFLKNSQISQENTCVGVSFQLYKKETPIQVFLKTSTNDCFYSFLSKLVIYVALMSYVLLYW